MDDFHMKRLEEYPDYWITADGRVYSELLGGRWLKPGRTPDGYLLVGLHQGGRGVTKKYVHRLVAEAFILNPEGKPQVNHRNGDKEDNRVENLEWATNAENMQHAYDAGLRVGVSLPGESCGRSKLAWEQVREIRERYAAGGVLQRELGAEYGVSQPAVALIVRGETWKEENTL